MKFLFPKKLKIFHNEEKSVMENLYFYAKLKDFPQISLLILRKPLMSAETYVFMGNRSYIIHLILEANIGDDPYIDKTLRWSQNNFEQY